MLSSLSDSELAKILGDYNIDIPDFKLDNDDIFIFIRNTIKNFENNSNFNSQVESDILEKFLIDISNLVNEYYNKTSLIYNVVTIIAVYKFDPSIVFSIDLTIINDVSNEEVVIQTTQIVKISNLLDGKYKVVLNETNCLNPWLQSYNWYIIIPDQMNEISATIDDYGYISVDGIGGVLLIGNYELNPNVTVKINISFE